VTEPAPISIIVPAWNEERRIGATLEHLLQEAGHLGIHELIVVNDGSTDTTSDIVRAHQCQPNEGPRLLLMEHPENRGKGAALQTGLLAATSPLIGYIDADLSVGPDPLVRARELIEGGADVVVGRRVDEQGRLGGGEQPTLRHVLARLFKRMQRAIVGLPIGDTQCPFKLFRAEVVTQSVPLCRSDGWAFDVEVLLVAHRAGYRIVELPVHWKFVGGSTVRADFRTVWRTMRDLITIRLRHGAA
jgi:dolichyl-phosphate beta-glucosyltransferase